MSEQQVQNSADKARISKAKKRETRIGERDHNDLAKLLDLVEFRRFIRPLIKMSAGSTFVQGQPDTTAFLEGERNQSNQLREKIRQDHFPRFMQILVEEHDEEKETA